MTDLHPFEAMAPDFRRRIAAAQLTRLRQTNQRAAHLVSKDVVDRFRPAHAELGIPLVWMICSFERESRCDFTRSPAQGDPWSRRSTHVPKGVGPFPTFEAAALWSYRHDGLQQTLHPWSLTYCCWAWNLFNGFGPNNRGRVSGYVFAGTDQYDPPTGEAGKYVSDGNWAGNAVDQQLGCLPLALRMITFAPELALAPDPDWTQRLPAEAPPAPVPAGLGGGSGAHSAAWVQDALNQIALDGAGTPLRVDNSYGRMTKNAVAAFQRGHGLAVDGLAGPETLAALENALRAILGPVGA